MHTQRPPAPPRAPAPDGALALAILSLRASDPHFDRNPGILSLRRALADRIEADIAALDLLGGDSDLEPSLGAPEPLCYGPMLRSWWDGVVRSMCDQTDWATGTRDDREADPAEGPEGGDEREADDADDEPGSDDEVTAPEWSGAIEQAFGVAGIA